MRVIVIRGRATMQMIEACHICNDDVAIERANQLRALDIRNEYRIDVLIPEQWNVEYFKNEYFSEIGE